jgi:hypothetical protein
LIELSQGRVREKTPEARVRLIGCFEGDVDHVSPVVDVVKR